MLEEMHMTTRSDTVNFDYGEIIAYDYINGRDIYQ